jgi:hypothetical protein
VLAFVAARFKLQSRQSGAGAGSAAGARASCDEGPAERHDGILLQKAGGVQGRCGSLLTILA